MDGVLEAKREKRGSKGTFYAIQIAGDWGICFQKSIDAVEGDVVEFGREDKGDDTYFSKVKKLTGTATPKPTQNPGQITTDERINRSVALKAAVELITPTIIQDAGPEMLLLAKDALVVAENFEKWLNR